MQRPKGKVTGFGDAKRRFNRLQIAHFADEYHIRVFAQRRAQGIAKRLGVRVHLALVDQAVLILVDELDRVFDSNDVVVTLGVDFVNHGRQGSRLARSRGAGHENQSARLFAEL